MQRQTVSLQQRKQVSYLGQLGAVDQNHVQTLGKLHRERLGQRCGLGLVGEEQGLRNGGMGKRDRVNNKDDNI